MAMPMKKEEDKKQAISVSMSPEAIKKMDKKIKEARRAATRGQYTAPTCTRLMSTKNKPNPTPAKTGRRRALQENLPPAPPNETNQTDSKARLKPTNCSAAGRPSRRKPNARGIKAVTTAATGATTPIDPSARPR